MKRMRKIFFIVIILWICIISIDFVTVFALHNKPLFMVMVSSAAQDDGDGTYKGLGYQIEIEGHFNDCDCILQGVVNAKVYLLDQPIYQMKRTYEP